VPVGGRIQATPGKVVHGGTHAGLSLEYEAVYHAMPGAVRVEGFVRDTTGRDRAVTVRVALPVDAVGGVWAADVQRSEPIADKVYAKLHRTPGVGATGLASAYPWGAITAATGGLALGVPMDHFVVHRIGYDGRLRSFYVEFDFGLSRLTKAFPSRADFKLVVFACDPAWAFRSAAANYYALQPEAFRRRAVREGLWMPFTDVAKVENAEDFNFVFQEGAPNVAYDERHGIYSFPYISPHWAWLWMPDRKEKPTPEYIQERIEAGLRSRDPKVLREAQLIANCAARNAEGAYHTQIGQAHWAPHREGHLGWYVMYAANGDPDLKPKEGPTTGAEALAAVERSIAQYSRPEAFVDGFYFDGVDERPLDNYATEQFVTADAPLTFGTKTHRPVLCGPFSSYKLVKRIAERLWSTGRLAMANGIPSRFPFSLAYLDLGGSELEPSIDREPVTVDFLVYARTLMYHKPLLLLYKPRFEERFERDLTPYLTEYMNTCLLYAAEPSLFKLFSNKDPSFYHSFFERPDWYNRYRSIFRDYLPLVRRLALAGWEPVTYARSSDARLLVERFGSGPNLHFVVYNPSHTGEPVATDLKIELARLGLAGTAVASDLGEGLRLDAVRAEGGLRVSLRVAPRRATVIAVRRTEPALADLELEEAVRQTDVAKSRLQDKLDQPLPIDFKVDPAGDGVPLGFGRYREGDATYRCDAKTFHSAPRSTSVVLKGKARATLSVNLPARAGAGYRFSAWTKAAAGSRAALSFYVRWLGNGNKEQPKMVPSTTARGSGEWQPVSLTATAPAGTTGLMLVLVASKSDPAEERVWFDDPSVVEEVAPGPAQTLLPLARKLAPADARQRIAELDRTGRRLESLLAAGRKEIDIKRFRGQLAPAAEDVARQAKSLAAANPEYSGSAAALAEAARRLTLAERMLSGTISLTSPK
jgi:hypothetical protein